MVTDLFYEPTEDRIIVEPLEAQIQSSGGVWFAEEYVKRSCQGIVIKVGPGKRFPKTGIQVPCECKPGDIVLFSRYEGDVMKTKQGNTYILLRESTGVLAIIPQERIEFNVEKMLN